MKIPVFYTYALAVMGILSCNTTGNKSANKADGLAATGSAAVVYYGGDILTMEGDSAQYAEALAVKDGKITFVGD